MQTKPSSEHRTGARIGAAALGCALAMAFGLSGCAPDSGGEARPTSSSSAAKGAASGSAKGSAADSASAKADAQASGDSDAGSVSGSTSSAEGKPNAGGSGSWSEQDSEEDLPKSTELPGSFPSADFVTGPGVVIDDAGERSGGGWFLVLRAADAKAADAEWQTVIASSGFAVADQAKTPEGGISARLTSDRLLVDALTLPQSDGSVLLSYDIERAG